MSDQLLAISLGPVQEFIAAARTTRDLWSGSWLLSDLARAAARSLADAGATLVFPTAHALATEAPVANKIVALVPDADPGAAAARARAAEQRRLETHAAAALDRAGALPVNRDLFAAQIAGFLEFFSAWAPCPAGGYAAARDLVERRLAGRKALRDFAPAVGAPGVPVSALDPSRQSVLRWATGPARSPIPIVRPREQLDAISLVKRLALQQRFASVSRVAIDPFIRRLAADQAGQQTLAKLRELASQLTGTGAVEPLDLGSRYAEFPYDTELFYGEDERVPEELRPIAQAFRDRVRSAGPGELPTAYALLVADGDHMGALIAERQTIAEHQKLSDQLASFAEQAGAILAAHHGVLVYSGGDDVLAFLPVDTALACADALRRAFSELIGRGPDPAPTLSVGLAITHYHDPLWEALERARAAEQAAKRDRNALAVALYTRAGAQQRTVVTSWSVDPVQTRWERWIAWHRQDRLPRGAVYELERLARELAALPPDAQALLVGPEVRRIIGRKEGARGAGPLTAEQVERALEVVAPGGSTGTEALAELAAGLIIARRIAAVVEMAPAAGADGEVAHAR